jgi:2-(1,2-epoxy-1,2-dihydrophenyl)acetyl-CoA isomerase
MPIPVVASVHGAIAGAGVSLTLAADLSIAADNAVFNLAYAKLGASPMDRHRGRCRASSG